jgi:DNA-binding GntR family transcriptional regulator
MDQVNNTRDRRTSVEMIFDALYEEIVSLRLLPGDKISEADIATRFGMSRQPVRDAFSRLENLQLLLIRPQKATEVRRFSTKAITKSRFVRAAVESEVLRRAAMACLEDGKALLAESLAKQQIVVSEKNTRALARSTTNFTKRFVKLQRLILPSRLFRRKRPMLTGCVC